MAEVLQERVERARADLIAGPHDGRWALGSHVRNAYVSLVQIYVTNLSVPFMFSTTRDRLAVAQEGSEWNKWGP